MTVPGLLYKLAWRVGAYLAWSKLYRRKYHKKYDKVSLWIGRLPSEILDALRKLKWTKDGPRELWDAVGSPRWVQYCVNEVLAGKPQPEGALDCDEFAVWAAAVMYEFRKPTVLNVFWKDLLGNRRGHHVCLFRLGNAGAGGKHGLYHIGNWGLQGPFKSGEDVIADILARRGLSKKALVGWALFTPALELRAYGHEAKTLAW